jgi:hypothetical protein
MARFMRMLNGERLWPVFIPEECMAVEEDIEFPESLRSRGAFIEGAPENPMAAMTGPPCSICFRPIEIEADGIGFSMLEINESGYAHRDCIVFANQKLKAMGGRRGWMNQFVEMRDAANERVGRAKAATGKRGFFLELD